MRSCFQVQYPHRVVVFALALWSLFGAAAPLQGQTVWYVDADALGANDGTTWTDAFPDLQAGIAAAQAGDQVWIAAGTYRPAPPNGDRTISFALKDGVAVYGGFAGGEGSIDERDPGLNPTMLSGDLNGDDTPTFANMGENSLHVLSAIEPGGTALIDGLVIVGGNANSSPSIGGYYGGGLLCMDSAVTVRGCKFEQNLARDRGGAIYHEGGILELTNCIILENLTTTGTSSAQGGGLYSRNGPVSLVQCVFRKNRSGNPIGSSRSWGAGGGLYIHSGQPAILNCLVTENLAGNYPETGGAGMYFYSAVPSIANSIVWGNTIYGGSQTESAQLKPYLFANVTRSCVQNWTGQLGGQGNFSADPMFMNPAGGDYHLLPDSPCIDAGLNLAPGQPEFDFDGQPRVQNCRIDIGPYESASFRDCNANGTADACELDAGMGTDCNQNATLDACESTADCDSNGVLDLCDLAAGAPDCNANGVPDGCDLASGGSADANGNGVPDECPIRYVDRAATGANDGTSWADAYTSLTTALSGAASGTQLWVAGGTYKPAAAGASRYMTFTIPRGVTVLGGFAGNAGDDPNERDLVQHETILSGDLNGDDVGTNGRLENVFTVVTPTGSLGSQGQGFLGPPMSLDGVTITAGFANQERSGGGLFAEGVYGLALSRITFANNHTGWDGGGLCSHHSRVTLKDCAFIGNTAGHDGGGLCHRNGILKVTGSRFIGNAATSGGGGLYHDSYNVDGFAEVTDCTFVGNTADSVTGFGSGVWIGGKAAVTHCAFFGNTAYTGGAACNVWTAARYVNCLFSGNAVSSLGGGFYTDGFTGRPTLTNCTVVSNAAEEGGGLVHGFGPGAAIANSILWGNADATGDSEVAQVLGDEVAVDYSLVQGWTGSLGGSGNSGGDPMFVDDLGPDGVAGTPDDNLRLRPESAATDSGDSDVDVDPVSPGVQPLPERDLDGNPRFVDDPNTADTGPGGPPVVDRGAYEFQASGAPAALLVGASSRKAHAGRGWQDIAIDLAGRVGESGPTSEPRNGGLTELRLAFDEMPGAPAGGAVTVLEIECGPSGPSPAAVFLPYSGIAAIESQWDDDTGELVLCFSPGLENARTYRILLGGEVTSLGGQLLDVRVLRGDADDNGRVNAGDRSAVVSVWTGPGFSPRTDIDGTGRTGAVDRSAVVEAWTGGQRWAP